jgi:hypothetical protein
MKFDDFHIFTIFSIFVNFHVFDKKWKNDEIYEFWSNLTIFTVLKIDEKSEKNDDF